MYIEDIPLMSFLSSFLLQNSVPELLHFFLLPAKQKKVEVDARWGEERKSQGEEDKEIKWSTECWKKRNNGRNGCRDWDGRMKGKRNKEKWKGGIKEGWKRKSKGVRKKERSEEVKEKWKSEERSA